MGWRFVRQPNGKIARFSEVVDDFTHYDLTEAEAFDFAFELMGRSEAEVKVKRCDDPCPWHKEIDRYTSAINTIRAVHGDKEADERDKMLRGESTDHEAERPESVGAEPTDD